MFKKTNNKWRKQKKLKPSNSLQLDHFGSSVKIHNKTIIVGAYGESSDSSGINNDMDNCQLASSGAVYVFNQKWYGWKQTDYIKSSNPSEFDMFGNNIDYEGGTLAVGTGEAYLFVKKGTKEKNKQWQLDAKFKQ